VWKEKTSKKIKLKRKEKNTLKKGSNKIRKEAYRKSIIFIKSTVI